MKIYNQYPCAKCEAVNLVDCGDPLEGTEFEPDGFRCLACQANNEIQSDGRAVETEVVFLQADRLLASDGATSTREDAKRFGSPVGRFFCRFLGHKLETWGWSKDERLPSEGVLCKRCGMKKTWEEWEKLNRELSQKPNK